MYKKLVGQTIIYGLGAIMPRVILFLLNPLLIDEMRSEQFAIFTNLYALISFVNIILSFGFETTFFRFSAEKENKQKVFNTAFWFLFFTASTFLAFCLVFNQSIANFLQYKAHPEYIRWFALIAFLDCLCVIPFAWLRLHEMPLKYSAVRVLQAVFQFGFVYALFFYIPTSFSFDILGLKSKVSYPFFSNLAASGLGFLLLLPIILKVRFQFTTKLFVRMIKYSWPIMIAGLAFMVNENFDKSVQIYLIPQSDAGAYGGAYKLAVLMTLFVTAYRLGVEPFFFKQMNNENAKKIYANITEYFTFFAATAALALIANLSWLKLILLPNEAYWTAIDIIPIIVLANLFFGIYYNLSTWYKVTDRTSVGTIISWIGAGFNILINLVALYYFQSIIGSAWATFIAYLAMMVVSYLWGQKYYPIPYRLKKLSFFLGLLFVFSWLIVKVFKYNFWLSNLAFLLFLVILLYSERQQLQTIIAATPLKKFIKEKN